MSGTARLALVLPGVLAAESPALPASVTLVKAGRPTATIVVAHEPTPAARLAAIELQHHVALITGAVLPIRTDANPAHGTRILVGESAATRRLGLRSSDLAPQEYVIRLRPRSIVLLGRDWDGRDGGPRDTGIDTVFAPLRSYRVTVDYGAAAGGPVAASLGHGQVALPGLYDDQATCYATYHFLERFCGVRWYGPGEALTAYPKRRTLTVRGPDVRRSPAMMYRFGTGTWDWPILKAQWGNPSPQAVALHWRRMRVGGERWGANHSFMGYYDRFWRQNPDHPGRFEGARPEFFAQGQTGGPGSLQLCYTNPALVQQVVQDARDYFDGKGLKGQQVAMGDYFALVPLDNANWCRCDRCQVLLARDATNTRGGHFNSGLATHYWFSFVNAVAREVRKTHPGKFIATLAYHVYAFKPTDMEVEPNVAVAPCLQIRNYWAPHIREHERAFYREWVAKRDRPIHLWNYYCFPEEPSVIQGTWRCFPGFSAHRIAEEIAMYHRDGVRGVFLCGIGEQVDFYLTMRLYDDASLDADAVLDEFFRRYFGAAAAPMREFYSLIERTYSSPESYPRELVEQETQLHQNEEIAWKYLGTEERMARLGALIARAEWLARTETEKARVALWRTGVWEYMVEGRRRYLARTGGR